VRVAPLLACPAAHRYVEKAHAKAEAGFEIEIIGDRRPAVRRAGL
jgi:TusA-related sulfurtransferase